MASGTDCSARQYSLFERERTRPVTDLLNAVPTTPITTAADIGQWSDPGPYDLILANAVLQWIPGHDALFPELADKLAPGGTLAVQMPDNLDEPAHRLMRDVAASGPWATKLENAGRPAQRRPEQYHAMLTPQCARVDVWRTVYYHPLTAGADGIVDWFKGSALRPYLAPLSDGEREGCLERYRDGVAEAYPALDDGTVLLAFPRMFIVATR
jgi:trans-aconitate 2-methyltransferase